ncbi:MAG TPA: YkvA family protein [Mycobacteriales bacterium]|nr:YkvA family protein [Mycobacteriales bacterium]
MDTALTAVVGLLAGLLLLWAVLVAVLAIARPRGNGVTEALRLFPDVLRLALRLAHDPCLPRGVRVRLWLLLAYLASPVDLVPDFIPVLGSADDAILIAITMRSVVRRAGDAALVRHWPGTPGGLDTLRGLVGIPDGPPDVDA